MSILQRPKSLPPRGGRLFASTPEKCWAAIEKGDAAGANGQLLSYLGEDNPDLTLAHELATLILQGGFFTEATPGVFDELLRQAPDAGKVTVLRTLRAHFQKTGETPKAYAVLKRLLALPGAQPGMLLEAGREALLCNLPDEALSWATRLAAVQGRDKEAQTLAMAVGAKFPGLENALALVNQIALGPGGDTAQAARFYEKIQEIHPDAPLPQRYGLALLAKAGQQEEALSRALAIKEKNPQDQWTLQQVLQLAVASANAPLVVETGFSLYGLTADPKVLEVVARFAVGLPPEQAVAVYERLLSFQPETGPWMITLARQNIRGGFFEKALAVMAQYTALPFANTDQAGTVLSALFSKAKEVYALVEEEAPRTFYRDLLLGLENCLEKLLGESAELDVTVGEELLRLNQPQAAERLFMRAVNHPAFRVRALVGEARSLLAQEKNQQAEGVATRALEELKNENKHLLWVATQAAQQANPAQAVVYLERFLRAHPQDEKSPPTSSDATALLEQLRAQAAPAQGRAPYRVRASGDPGEKKPVYTDPMKRLRRAQAGAGEGTEEEDVGAAPAPEAPQATPTQVRSGEDDAAYFKNLLAQYNRQPTNVPTEVGALQGAPRTPGEAAKESLFSRYKTEKTIGKGGMGTVYMASDTLLERVVAIKIITSAGLTTKDTIDRMAREAKAIAKLSHPNVISVYDVGLFEDFKYLVMEYVDGLSLKQLITRRGGGGLPVPSTRHIALQVADALYHAHERAIVHRDVKPDNVLVSRSGEVKVMDFGLAKFVDNSEQTIDGITAGTLQYMAPEQFSGKHLDHRVDVYAFGCMLFEMLTGKPPFEGSELTKMMYLHLHEPPPPLPESLGKHHDHLQTLIHRCMAKLPEGRPATMKEVHDLLGQVG